MSANDYMTEVATELLELKRSLSEYIENQIHEDEITVTIPMRTYSGLHAMLMTLDREREQERSELEWERIKHEPDILPYGSSVSED